MNNEYIKVDNETVKRTATVESLIKKETLLAQKKTIEDILELFE